MIVDSIFAKILFFIKMHNQNGIWLQPLDFIRLWMSFAIFAPMSRKKEKEIVRGVTVESVGAEGKAVARIDGKVVFMSNAVPGDVVAVRIDKRREKYFEGTLVEIEQPSPDRVEPFCEHYKDCGGCAWQELPYHLQLKYKQQQVVDQFSRIGHLPMDQVEVLPILPSERTTEYRNKLEFTFSDRRWLLSGEDPSTVFDPPVPLDPSEFEGGVFPRHLRGGYSSVNGNPAGFALGFHISKAVDKILDIRHCWLQPEPSNEIRNFIRQYAIVHGLPFFNIREQTGFLRNIIIRTNLRGEVMLTVMFGARPPKLGKLRCGFRPEDCDAEAEKFFDVLMERFPQIKSLNYLYNGRMNDAINDQEILNARGEDAIYEEMEGLRFKIGPKSFYQTNPLQAYRLYSTVREFADFQGGEHVYDLYTGTGTIALFVARSVLRRGHEGHPDSGVRGRPGSLAGRGDTRPAQGRGTPFGHRGAARNRGAEDRVRKLQSGYTGPRPRHAHLRRSVQAGQDQAGGHVPAHHSCGECGASGKSGLLITDNKML